MNNNKRALWITAGWALCFLTISIVLYSCGQNNNLSSHNRVTTVLKSTSLGGPSAQAVSFGTLESGSWVVTPSAISGETLSILFPIDGLEDQGVVVYGNGRPDIAPPLSDLQYFNFSTGTSFEGTINKKPGFIDGYASSIMVLFGYFDVSFLHNGSDQVIRMVYGTTTIEGLGTLARGDKLLRRGGQWQWYDKNSSAFTSSRPANPVSNEAVANFVDPVRPTMHYYFVSATLTSSLEFTNNLIDNNSLAISADFNMGNSIVFDGVSSEADFNSLSDAALLGTFNMRQNVNNPATNPGITCIPTMQATPVIP